MKTTRPIEILWLGRTPFPEALDIQHERHARVLDGSAPDTLLLLEHDPVFTIGRTADQSSLGPAHTLPHPLHRIGRGGQATYHGPGQLIGYPIINLRHHRQDLHAYLRAIEAHLIAILDSLAIKADRRGNLTGVWIDNRKIASIGVGVRKWTTLHGFALNVHGPQPGFDAITPCGIQGVRMTTAADEAGHPISVREAATIAANTVPILLKAIA